jgi:hypothetical protein
MAIRVYKCPPTPSSGTGTFSDELVGFQLVTGGGLTQGNFIFSTTFTEKVNRNFFIGSFSEPISLDTLKISSLQDSKAIIAKEFRVYPNFDLSEVTRFNLYGPLTERMSASVKRIINFFPAALEVSQISQDATTGFTATNVLFDPTENVTTFDIDIEKILNPFGIDFSINATRNISLLDYDVSYLRNLTTAYTQYSLYLGDLEYPVVHLTPSFSLYSGLLNITVSGNPFSGLVNSVSYLVIRPNDFYSDKSLIEPFDEVEQFLLNRLVTPKYTATFKIPAESDEGVSYINNVSITWPTDGVWNLDIRTNAFDTYIAQLSDIADTFDSFKTDLVARFLTTQAFKDFDTSDQKMQKILNIYGRSFDEVKKFIDTLAYMNSVNYVVKDDIPSQLLKNLAETIGWRINISPITNDNFLDSVFGNQSKIEYPGYSRANTPTELNYQFYRNLILNAAYLFKSKGTRRSVEFMLRLVGAPEALIEFNENVYISGQRINLTEFDEQYASISGGTYTQILPIFDTTGKWVCPTGYDFVADPSQPNGVGYCSVGGCPPCSRPTGLGVCLDCLQCSCPNPEPIYQYNTFTILGITYTGYTTTTVVEDSYATLTDYPIDDEGYPYAPPFNENYFFQKGEGWFELSPQHQSLEQIDISTSVFTGQNFNIQTYFEPFTYGQKYLERYRHFPYMSLGFNIVRNIDNRKSWTVNDVGYRLGTETANYDAYYYTSSDRNIINVKNVDLYLNPAQGLAYDVWYMSNKYDYPIPSTGLTAPYPQAGGVDWTVINPQPNKKTFFEFAQTFWQNMINVRNRFYTSDGKTSGYPTLSSIYWDYLQSELKVNIPNDNFTYRTMIDYVTNLGDYWMRLVEQVIPATTIWNGGTKYENSIFHRQKFVYRYQTGCQITPLPCNPCKATGNLFPNICANETVNCYVYPWDNGLTTVTSFQDVLVQTLNGYLATSGLTTVNCPTNTLKTNWYLDFRLNGTPLIEQLIYTGYDIFDYPTPTIWLNVLQTYLPSVLLNYGLGITFDLTSNKPTFTVYNLGCDPMFYGNTIELNVGLNFSIVCS